MGKPENRKDAYRMLKQLSGKTHTVVSGVAIVWKGKAELFHEETSVTFYELDEELLSHTIRRGPMVYRGWGSCLCENCMEIISMLWDCRLLQFTVI